MTICYRRATIKDKKILDVFYKKAYGEKAKFLSDPYWSWLNTQNPLHENKLTTHTYIAVDEVTNAVAGHYTVVPQNYKVANRAIQFSWGVNLFVDPEYRGRGIAKKLQTLLIEEHDIYTAISIADSTRKMIMGMEGAIEFPKTYTLSLPLALNRELIMALRMRNYRVTAGMHWLTALLRRSKYFIKLGTPLLTYSLAKKARRLLHKRLAAESFNMITETNINNPVFLNVRSEITQNFGAAPDDSPEYLKWKFDQHPTKKYKVFVCDKGNRERGYIILRTGIPPEQKVGFISEIFATSGTCLNELISFAKAYFLEEHCLAVHVVMQHPDYVNAFKKAGFIVTNKRIPVALALEKSNIEFMDKVKTWFFTFESQDLDFFPNIRV